MNKAILGVTQKLLEPLVRILLRNGTSFGTFSDLAKRVFIEVADKEFGIKGRKQTVSRISMITGINRKEVRRVKETPTIEKISPTDRYNRAGRVIAGWRRDRKYLDSKGNPATLPIEGGKNSFASLVKEFSGDIPVRAVLDELLRVEGVKRVGKNRVRLMTRAYIPRTDESNMLGILGTAGKDLLSTIDHNLCLPAKGSSDGYFQRAVSYDNLPEESIPGLRDRSFRNGQKLLENLDRWMATQDRDLNPGKGGTGRKRAGIGIYYFEENLPQINGEKS